MCGFVHVSTGALRAQKLVLDSRNGVPNSGLGTESSLREVCVLNHSSLQPFLNIFSLGMADSMDPVSTDTEKQLVYKMPHTVTVPDFAHSTFTYLSKVLG